MFSKVVSSIEKYALIESTIRFRNSCYLTVEIFQIVRSEKQMDAEGDHDAETSSNDTVDSLHVPLPPRRRR